MRDDLRHITFVIPFYYDSEERLQNLKCIVKYLEDKFATNIIIVESGYSGKYYLPPASTAQHHLFNEGMNEGIFLRTKTINFGLKLSATDFVCIYDTDVLFDPGALIAASIEIKYLFDAVYPYGGEFVDIDRGYINHGVIKERVSFATGSVGGAVFINRKKYIEAGMENENIIGWGPEDMERYERMKTFNFRIQRIPGRCYHITHARGINSGPTNPYTENNLKELEKVRNMNRAELHHYKTSWSWIK